MADNPGLMFGARAAWGGTLSATRDECRVNRDLRAVKKGAFAERAQREDVSGVLHAAEGVTLNFRDPTATVDDVRGARGSNDGGGPPPVPRRSI